MVQGGVKKNLNDIVITNGKYWSCLTIYVFLFRLYTHSDTPNAISYLMFTVLFQNKTTRFKSNKLVIFHTFPCPKIQEFRLGVFVML